MIFACAAVLRRLKHLEAVLVPCERLAAGQFTVADILMTNVLRLPKAMSAGDFPAIRSYVDQAYAHPAFKIAYDGQAHFVRNLSVPSRVHRSASSSIAARPWPNGMLWLITRLRTGGVGQGVKPPLESFFFDCGMPRLYFYQLSGRSE